MNTPNPAHLALAFVLAAAIALAARGKGALTASGAFAAFVVGFLVFGFARGRGAAALLLFFVSSTALSRYRKRDKERLATFEKGGERDAAQVLANGGAAALCALLVAVFPGSALPFVALLGALAEANADTWATELGSLAKKPPRLITTLRPAAPGASGAVSLPGTLAALAGAALVATVAFSPAGFLAATTGGVAGALVDSLLGATLQVQYRCPVCRTLTERRVHCDGCPTEIARGLPWLNNDIVNALATVVGALVSAGLLVLLQR